MSKTKRPEAATVIQAQIGERISKVRTVLFNSGAEAARALQVDTSTLGKIEKGERAPSIFFLMACANRMRMSVEFFATGRIVGIENSSVVAAVVRRYPELGEGSQNIGADMDRTPFACTVVG